jgi:hypothetical protein
MGTLLQSLLICCKCSVAIGWTKPPQHSSSSSSCKLQANKSFDALQQNPKLCPQKKTTRIILLILLPTFDAWKSRCDKSFMHYNKTQNWVLRKRTTRNNLLILLLTFAAWKNRCDKNTKRESLNLLTVELINGTEITTSYGLFQRRRLGHGSALLWGILLLFNHPFLLALWNMNW